MSVFATVRIRISKKKQRRPRLNLTVEVNDLAFHQERFVNFELGPGVQMSYLYERFFNMQIFFLRRHSFKVHTGHIIFIIIKPHILKFNRI